MKGIMQFGKKSMSSPRCIRPYRIVRRIENVAHELDSPSDLEAVHLAFHVSMLRECIGGPPKILPVEKIQVMGELSGEEQSVIILDRQGQRLRTKDIPLLRSYGKTIMEKKRPWK